MKSIAISIALVTTVAIALIPLIAVLAFRLGQAAGMLG
jgi:hypothetical protein